MEVGHYLPRFRPAVDGHPVAAFGNALLSGHPVGHLYHLPNERHFGVGHVRQGGDMFPGDDQQMHGGYWVDIVENDDIFVLVKEFRGYFPADYLAENTVFIFIYLPHPLCVLRPLRHLPSVIIYSHPTALVT